MGNEFSGREEEVEVHPYQVQEVVEDRMEEDACVDVSSGPWGGLGKMEEVEEVVNVYRQDEEAY